MKKQYIEFKCIHQKITRTDEFFVVGGSKNYLHARFDLCEDWAGEQVMAIFEAAGKPYTRLIENGECCVPWEVLQCKNFFVSCVAGSLITSNAAEVKVSPCGATDGTPGAEPTPSAYEQMVSIMEETKEIAQSVRDDADNGMFDGEKGDPGTQGEIKKIVSNASNPVCIPNLDSGAYILKGTFKPYTDATWTSYFDNCFAVIQKVEGDHYNRGYMHLHNPTSNAIHHYDFCDNWSNLTRGDMKYLGEVPKLQERVTKLEENGDDVDLTDYVKKTDYATAYEGGVVKVPTIGNVSKGIYISSEGILAIRQARENEIAGKTNIYNPLVPATLDYAIKVGLTTNTQTLTKEEKQAACEWLGVVDAVLAALPNGDEVSY